jgi:oligopeptide transport system substrate-binding protein
MAPIRDFGRGVCLISQTAVIDRRYRRSFYFIRVCRAAVLLLVVWSLTACRHRETPVELGIREQILHVGNGAEPRDLDPNTAVSVTESTILNALFEGLTAFTPDCRDVVPGAAERWEVSPDGRTYTFHLRPGLRWSNGDPLTSADFLYSFRRLIEPQLGAEQAIYADEVEGAKDYREGRIHDLAAVGFHAPDPLTFEIRLKERAPYILGLLASNPFCPLHRPTLEKYDAYLRRDGAWTKPGRLVGNGPFRLLAWRINDAVVVEKNPFYWNAAHTRLHQVFFHPIDNPDSEERAFRGGLLHVTRGVPTAKLPGYKHDHPTWVYADPVTSTRYVTFNVSRAPFDDVRVRRAFAYALNRAAIVDDVMRDGSRVADSLTVPGSDHGYSANTRLPFDPERARALLAEAGFAGGAGLPAITLNFTPAHQGEQRVVEALQAMWSRELGARVGLVAQEEKVWLDTLRTRNFQLLMDAWSSGINDPIDMLQLFLSDSPNNDASWTSKAYDAAYAAAGRSASDAERDSHMRDCDAILIDQLPLIPLYHENINYLVHPAVRGWQSNILGIHLLSPVFLEPQT